MSENKILKMFGSLDLLVPGSKISYVGVCVFNTINDYKIKHYIQYLKRILIIIVQVGL